MVGALNKLPIAVSGMIFFTRERRVINMGNIVSILGAFASGIIYGIAQIQIARQKMIDVVEEDNILLKQVNSTVAVK